jgi:hypothetical protein
MKKIWVYGLCAVFMLSGCATSAGTGAYMGGQFGHAIGSAVGGISNGWRGSNVGALIGLAGGAIAGAAIGSAVDHAQQRRYERQMEARQAYEEERAYHAANSDLQIRNACVVDANVDMALTRNEQCSISFDIMNYSDKPMHNVMPSVIEVTGNKHVSISPNLNIECIHPGQGVRYTASVKADNKLGDGELIIRIGISHNNHEIGSQTQELRIPTRKRNR